MTKIELQSKLLNLGFIEQNGEYTNGNLVVRIDKGMGVYTPDGRVLYFGYPKTHQIDLIFILSKETIEYEKSNT